MDRDGASPSAGEIANELSAWNVGGGLITMALFPLALPILILTVVAMVPLLLLGLAGVLAAAAVALPILIAWRVGRRAIGALRPTSRAARAETPAR